MIARTWKIISIGLSLLLTTGCPRPVTNYDNRTYNQSDDNRHSTQSTDLSTDGVKAPESSGGTINGGGGKGVRCTKDGKIKLEMLDLYEAKAIYGLTPLNFGTDETKARAELARIFAKHSIDPGNVSIDKYAAALDNYVLKNLVVDKIRFVEAPKKLKVVQDDYAPLLEKDCELVQVALFYDESSLLVDRSLWNQLDVTNRTALLAHELVYASARGQGITNSVSSRKLVAFLLSEQGTPPLFDGVPTSDYPNAFHCAIEENRVRMGDFYMFPRKGLDQTDSLYIAFSWGSLMNPFLFKTSTTLENVELRQLVSSRPYSFALTGELNVAGYTSVSGDISFQFLGSEGNRSKLNGFVAGVAPGKTGEPGRWSFSCDVPRELSQILPAPGIAKGEYLSKGLVRGIYKDTLIVDDVGGITLRHEASYTDPSGQNRTCQWTETGIAEKSGDSIRLLRESVTMDSRDDEESICLTEFNSAQAQLKSEGYLAYDLDLKEYSIQK